MGFVKINQDIEDWLEVSCIGYDGLSDSEYKKILKAWRYSFEIKIQNNNYMCKGETAMSTIEEKLPFDCFIFSFTGCKLLPASVGTKSNVFGYWVNNLTYLDKQILNSFDAIVCDESVEFSCLYTHEWLSLALPEYYERGNSE